MLPRSTLTLTLNTDHCGLLMSGGAYAIITTDEHPGGEIRGQVFEEWHVNPVEEVTWGQIKRRYR